MLPWYAFDLMALQLINYPEDIDKGLKIATDADNSIVSNRKKENWGTTSKMEEIDLYK